MREYTQYFQENMKLGLSNDLNIASRSMFLQSKNTCLKFSFWITWLMFLHIIYDWADIQHNSFHFLYCLIPKFFDLMRFQTLNLFLVFIAVVLSVLVYYCHQRLCILLFSSRYKNGKFYLYLISKWEKLLLILSEVE